MQRNGREHERQRARKLHTPGHRVGQPASGGMTGIKIRRGRQNADNGTIERFVGEAGPLEEAATQEQRKLLIPVLSEARPQPFFHDETPTRPRAAADAFWPRSEKAPAHCAIGLVYSTGK